MCNLKNSGSIKPGVVLSLHMTVAF